MRVALLMAGLWFATSHLQAKIVFYSKRDENLEIYTMDSDGSNQTRLTHHARADWSPTWAPNGQQIAFVSERDGNSEVYVMDADGKNQRRLTRHPGIDGYPDWSPGGSQIVFRSSRGGKELNQDIDIFVMQADGSNVRQITRLGFASRPKWSPDGKRIAFEAVIDDGRQVYAVNADGTHRWQVSKPEPEAAMFVRGWSPDGKRILYMAAIGAKSNNASFVMATLDPSGRSNVKKWERIPLPKMGLSLASWGADGKSILFSGAPHANWDIYRYRIDSGQLMRLTFHFRKDTSPQEWNPRLPVQVQGVLPQFWGSIKSSLLQP